MILFYILYLKKTDRRVWFLFKNIKNISLFVNYRRRFCFLLKNTILFVDYRGRFRFLCIFKENNERISLFFCIIIENNERISLFFEDFLRITRGFRFLLYIERDISFFFREFLWEIFKFELNKCKIAFFFNTIWLLRGICHIIVE